MRLDVAAQRRHETRDTTVVVSNAAATGVTY